MKIKVELNTQSIHNAINTLTTARKQLQGKMLDDLLKAVSEQIISLANDRIALTDIGYNVKQSIINGWEPIQYIGKTSKWLGIKLVNSAEKAVYIEFGVGIIGQQKPHNNSDIAGYQYNMPSKSKLADGSWIFKIDDNADLDISLKSVDNRTEHTVRTKGQVGYMYLYNAIVDFKDRNLAQKIWSDIKRKYWG